MTIQDHIDNCLASAEDARGHGASAYDAFEAALPAPTNRRNAQALIACVVVGIANGCLMLPTAKTLLYAAQIALMAHAKRPRSRGLKGETA